MSQERIEDLRANVLYGFTEQRGTHAWHYDPNDPVSVANHYDGPVPPERAAQHLDIEVVQRPLYFRGATKSNVRAPRQVAWVRKDQLDDPKGVLGYTGNRYVEHPYKEWVYELAQALAGTDVGIGSVGTLKNGARSWIQLEIPSNRAVGNLEYRGGLLVTSTYDRSMSTTAKLVQTIVQCDNTREAALSESGSSVKWRHLKSGEVDLEAAREALGLLVDTDPFAAELEMLANTTVSDSQWDAFVKELTGDVDRTAWTKTIVGRRREELNDLWMTDERVSPWRGTALGALQAANTWSQWMRLVKGEASRPERNMAEVINGKMRKGDRQALAAMAKAGVRLPKDFGLSTKAAQAKALARVG